MYSIGFVKRKENLTLMVELIEDRILYGGVFPCDFRFLNYHSHPRHWKGRIDWLFYKVLHKKHTEYNKNKSSQIQQEETPRFDVMSILPVR